MLAAIAAVIGTEQYAPAITTSTVTYQQGVDGYASAVERKISEIPANDRDGSAVGFYFLDGYTGGTSPSPDEVDLLKFGDIVGVGAGQIPPGAFILDAQLQITTAQVSGSAQTNGPWGVAGLNQEFTPATTYTSFDCGGCALISRGPWWQDGIRNPETSEIVTPYTTRPAGGFGGQLAGAVASAPVTALVQNWASGAANHGVVIQSGFTGTTDGWQISTISNANTAARPKLSVTYTTDPISVNTFQRGLNNYEGDTMAWVRSGLITTAGTAATASVDDITYNGQTGEVTFVPSTTDPPAPDPTPITTFQQFLDGPNGTDSPDDVGLIKFTNVFGGAAGQSPADKTVAKAWLVVTTGDTSANARTPGAWQVAAMQRDWTTTSLYSSFGDVPGLSTADGDVSAPLDTKIGFTVGSEVWFDVTGYLESVRTGTTDYGLVVSTGGTADGWQIHLNGSDVASARPRLVVASDMSSVIVGVPGDFNNDTFVDAADYTVFRDNLGSSFNLNGNGNETGASAGIVDQADYDLWALKFGGGTGSGVAASASVPEPQAWVVLVLGGLVGAACCRS